MALLLRRQDVVARWSEVIAPHLPPRRNADLMCRQQCIDESLVLLRSVDDEHLTATTGLATFAPSPPDKVDARPVVAVGCETVRGGAILPPPASPSPPRERIDRVPPPASVFAVASPYFGTADVRVTDGGVSKVSSGIIPM